MEEGEMEESESMSLSKSAHNPEIISIRKKLAAPNDILPGAMIRSQTPVHLLPVSRDFESESGFQMLLDHIEENCPNSPNDKMLTHRLKNFIGKGNKPRSKSEIGPQKLNEPVQNSELGDSIQKKVTENDPLGFLCHNIKNVLNYPESILFVSKTAIVSNVRASALKAKIMGAKSSPQTNQKYLNYLNSVSLFGVTPYAYDQFRASEISELPKYYNISSSLQFDDDFQSSNLYLAMSYNSDLADNFRKDGEKYDQVYLATVRLDYNTKSYGQWFYFKVKRAQQSYSFRRSGSPSNFFKFMIINMTKSSSMFGRGLKVSVCRKGVWRKEGINIRYYMNSLSRQEMSKGDSAILNSLKQEQRYFTLEFTLQIFEGEQLYVSYNEPYTYTRVGRLLDRMTNVYEENVRNIVDIKRHVVCQTYLNNNIEVINFSAKNSQNNQQKSVIFIMGRCHPVQTAGSHVAEGIINKLYSLFIESPLEEHKNHIIYKLLERYIIKIIPMTNPDGVILGNSRCNLAGYDLNRSWRHPKVDRCRQIYEIKKYILQYQNRIAMFIDLHAHSKKKNVFAYGCHDMSDPFATRQFPFLLSKLSENDFLFSQCRFTPLKGRDSQKGSKDGTARVFLYDILRIPNVFTIENSYCSAKNSLFHYDKASFEIIGGDILKAIYLYFSPTFRNSEKWQADKQSYLLATQKLSSSENKKQQDGSQILKISLNGKAVSNISLNVTLQTVNHPEPKAPNIMSLREKYLDELRSKGQNVTIGLMRDEGSQSEEEERIYEIPKRYLDKSNSTFARKNKHTKTSQKIISYLNKTRQPIEGRKDKNQKFPNQNHQRDASSTHSEINLVKVTNSTKYNRFQTVSKSKDQTYVGVSHQQEKNDSPSMTHLNRKKRELEDNIFRETKKERQLSIIEIGLDGEGVTTHNYRVNIGQKIEGKFPRAIHHREESPRQMGTFKSEAEKYLNRRREEEIKDYLRRLVRPKQMLQRRYRLGCRQEKKQLKIKHSNIQFAEGRLTRLLLNQGTTPKLHTEHVGV